MARLKVEWSVEAVEERLDILSFWIDRTGSTKYPRKLDALIARAVELISMYPLIGKPSNIPNVRTKIIRDYLLICRVTEDSIQILAFWDPRRDPEALAEELRKRV
jgi:addiction module RelE/StbE family toxin